MEQIKKDAKLQKELDEKEAERIKKERYNKWWKQERDNKWKQERDNKWKQERDKKIGNERTLNGKESSEQRLLASIKCKLKTEFNLLLNEGNSYKYARRKLLLKYHPDKNKQTIEKLSTIMIQQINELF